MTEGRNGDHDADLEALEFEPLDPATELAAVQMAGEAVQTSLAEALDKLATADPSIERGPTSAGVEFRFRGRPFARLDGDTAAFRLRPEVVRAALRTAGTRPSPLGSDWIAFRPSSFDRYALDRATSWFELAARLAPEGSSDRRRRS